MKQYTGKDQTAKLIELGFPKPQGWGNKDISNGMSIALYNDGREDFNYSIGELIEFLPKRIDSGLIDFFFGRIEWFVRYEDRHEVPPITVKQWHSRELIDALFCACVTLKEEGGIVMKDKWIKVSDRLPEDGQACLIVTKPNVFCFKAKWSERHRVFLVDNTELGYYKSALTHWQPIELPEEE